MDKDKLLEKKRILIVDDVSDTGDTYEAAITHLQDFQPREIRTAVLLHKTTAKYKPDFIARRVVKWRWMIYPWAVIEDLGGFVTRMSPKPRDAGEIGQHRIQQIARHRPGRRRRRARRAGRWRPMPRLESCSREDRAARGSIRHADGTSSGLSPRRRRASGGHGHSPCRPAV